MAATQISSVAGGGVMLQADASLQRSVYVKIIEEPASKALRFRYECEGRSAGSLPGATSTQDKKSFPKIQVHGYRGRAVVVVSCVTIDAPFRPHPHNLVGKEGCKKGVCTMEIANDDMTCEFSNLGIQCVKKKDIEDSLKVREEIRVDPFRTGFQHKTQPGSIDLNSVRLCFQVFLEGPERGQFKVPLKPVVSEPIYDKKAINDLTIMKLSDCTSPVMGGKEIILLCDKVSKDDIEIRFYEESEETGAIVWEGFGDFQPSDVHKQYAICFRTPQYNNLEITSPSRVYVQLRCPSKETTSAPRPFQYIPLLTSGTCKRKWNLLSFSSGAYSSYLTTSSPAPPAVNGVELADGNSPKKHRPVQLEDILADEAKVDPIYDRLNEFMGIGKMMSGRGDDNEHRDDDGDDAMERGEHVSAVVTEEDIYDVDLELISQIIRSQEEDGGQVIGGGGIGELTGMEIDDLINGNGDGSLLVEQQVMMSAIQAGDTIILPQSPADVPLTTTQVTNTQLVEQQQQQPVPPTRPPKRQQPADPGVQQSPAAAQTQVSAPPLPPKKSTPKQSPTKQSPAAFLKNLLFSPTKKNKQKNNNTTTTNTTAQRVPPPAVDPTAPPPPPVPSVGPYELTENLGLYVDNDAPLATASEFGDDDVVVVAQSGGGGAHGATRDDPNQYYCSVVNNNQGNAVNNN